MIIHSNFAKQNLQINTLQYESDRNNKGRQELFRR